MNDKNSVSPVWYAIGGAAVGVAVGMLFAPKKGSELRLDLGELGRNGREKSKTLMGRLNSMIPLRVKAAAAIGALKAGGTEAVQIAKEDLHLNGADNA